MATDRFLLVDGNNILMRAVHAADRVPLQADGIPTAALLIFINLLSRHIREEAPTHVVVCWDGGRSVYRTAIYADYKGHREQRAEGQPDDRGPFSQAKEFCTLAGLHHVERPGWEADDLIACLTRQIRLERPSAAIVILSGDKDLLQLLDEPNSVGLLGNTTQVRPVSQPPTDRWTEARVQAEYGVPARYLSRAMALIGDPGDNIPGVHGIGPKKAAKLLAAAHYDLGAAIAGLSEPEQQSALLSYALVDLCDITYGEQGLVLSTPPAFSPTSFAGVLFPDLMRYLERYRLESVKTRLLSQSLWRDPTKAEEGNGGVPGLQVR